MTTYEISSRDGSYIGTVRADTEIDACYALYHAVWGGYPGHGTVLDADKSNLQTYVLLGVDEGPNFFDHYQISELPLTFQELIEKLIVLKQDLQQWQEYIDAKDSYRRELDGFRERTLISQHGANSSVGPEQRAQLNQLEKDKQEVEQARLDVEQKEENLPVVHSKFRVICGAVVTGLDARGEDVDEIISSYLRGSGFQNPKEDSLEDAKALLSRLWVAKNRLKRPVR